MVSGFLSDFRFKAEIRFKAVHLHACRKPMIVEITTQQKADPLMLQRRDQQVVYLPLFGSLLGSCLRHILSKTPVSPLQTGLCKSRTPAEIRTDRASSLLNEGLNDLIAVGIRRHFLQMQPHKKPQPLMCACSFNEPS